MASRVPSRLSNGVASGLSLLAATLVAASSGCHRYDSRQVPVVTVSAGLRPTIAWTPEEAYTLSMYRGEQDGDGIGVLWTARGSGDYANDLRSPVIYGIPPSGSEVRDAPALEAGVTYTVVIWRMDPKGTGDGFTARRHRYVGTMTFVATDP